MKKPFDIAFIDLDDTIYDTQAFISEIRKIFASVGVTEDDFVETLRHAVYGDEGDFYDYTFEKHLVYLKRHGYEFSEDNMLQRLNSLFRQDFVDPEAHTFLTHIAEISKQVVLLTAGNEAFQRRKIVATDLEKYFDEYLFCHGDKVGMVAPYKEKHVLFVNDNLTQNMAVAAAYSDMVVMTRWIPKKYSEEQVQESNIPYFDDLSLIQDYVSEIAS